MKIEPSLVSILIPAYNAKDWIAEAIRSALDQSYENVEILVGDNASTDETLEVTHSFADPRIRIYGSSVNVGGVGNHNRLAALSSGSYLKYLHADDVLFPDCVASLVEIAGQDDGVGIVFAPRCIVTTSVADAWMEEFGRPHEHFHDLQPVNDGRMLAWQLLDAGFANWIGEPSSVLVTRRAIETVGLFNPRLNQISDLELWLRIALRFRVGFVDRPLSSFRHHDLSDSAANAASGGDWLEPLWLAESLAVFAAAGPDERRLVRLRNRRLLQAFKNQAIRLRHGYVDDDLIVYFYYRARHRRAQDARRVLHPSLG